MFCTKCGTQNPEEAGFCVKCGAKLVADNPVPETAPPTQQNVAGSAQPVSAPNVTDNSGQKTPPQPTNQTAPPVQHWSAQPQQPYTVQQAPVKKKSKAPFIAIGAVLVIAAVLIMVFNWNGGVDYIATVKAIKPFADDYELPYTYGEVLDKYISNAKWESHETKSGTYVEVSGKGSGTDKELILEFEVSDIPENDDQVWVSPHSATLDGEKLTSEDEAGGVLLILFMAYDENCKDLAEIADTFLSEDTSDTVNRIGDIIEINETKSYDNDSYDEHFQITLDYVKFVDKTESILGGYSYPDEECVYLKAVMEVENVGTEVAMFTSSNSVVYDGNYEFFEESSDFWAIKPLTSAQSGAMVFEVPESVMTSDKPLVLNIGNRYEGEPHAVFVIR